MFVRNAWYVAAWTVELEREGIVARTILGVPTVLYRGADGRVGALEDRCCHRGLPLSMGRVRDDRLKCGYHGLEFDAAGRCVLIPGQEDVPSVMKVGAFAVVEKDALIWIWGGDRADADEALIPSFGWHDDPAWPSIPHVQHLKCAFNLVIDNLLDQTHLAYVHTSTIGDNPHAHAIAEMEIEETERGMYFMRWLENQVPPPIYVQADIGFAADVPMDRWAEFEYIAPGTVLQFTGGLPSEERPRATGRRDGGWGLRIMHNITPETETTCHYFWAGCHGFRQDDPEVTRWVYEQLRDTFLEDEAVLEAQQARLSEMPGRLLPTKYDAARIAAERALIRLQREDEAARSARSKAG